MKTPKLLQISNLGVHFRDSYRATLFLYVFGLCSEVIVEDALWFYAEAVKQVDN